MIDKARLTAYKGAKRIFEGAFSNLVLPDASLIGLDRAFAESIMLGTVERKITLEYILSMFIKQETDKDLSILLMTGIYQILYMDRVPDNAVCDETVKISKFLFGPKTSGFVNAVLRNICRNKDDVLLKVEGAEEYIKYSVNKELFDLLKCQYTENYKEIFESFFKKTPLFARVNTLLSTGEKVAKAVDGEVINQECVAIGNLPKAVNGMASGEYFIQGRASQMTIELLDPQPNETIIDVCACPGGKSLAAAIRMKNTGRIHSFDLHEKKLPLIIKSAETLGISIINVAKHDGRTPVEEFIGTADRVICDVPCSGTGVIGNKPEIKYKSPSEFEGLYKTQARILESAAKYLKPGGIMVYSTCSINKIENEHNVASFLEGNNKFKLLYEETCMPYSEISEGFYMAKIIREK